MTHRPTLAPDARSPDLIHSSTFTVLSTNADPTGVRRARVLLRISKCEIGWRDGDLSVRFSGHALDVTPRPKLDSRRGAR